MTGQAGAIVRYLILGAYVALFAACGGPFLLLPGGALDGPEASISDVQLSGEDVLIQLETRPDDPYSVNLNAFFVNGSLYVDPAEDRTWYGYLEANPNVRVKLEGDDTVYTAKVVVETDPDVVARFEADRVVMRLAPR